MPRAKGIKARKRSQAECVGRDHGEKDAERLIRQCTPDLGLPARAAKLAHLQKGDVRKAMLAALLRRRTSVGFEWIATRLHMGHPGSVSRLVCGLKRDRKLEIKVNELVNPSFSNDCLNSGFFTLFLPSFDRIFCAAKT